MKSYFPYFVLFSLLLGFGCSPKNEEIKDEQIAVSPSESVADSLIRPRKDAVQTDENNTATDVMPLPQPVLALLQEQYPGWEQPTLTQETQQQASKYDQGPFIVRVDFNGDNQQDYALQLQQERQVHFVAIMQQDSADWQVLELGREILFNERGKLLSLYHLYEVEPGTTLYDSNSQEEFETAQEAVGIGISGDDQVYVYRNGDFAPYNLPAD